MLYDANAPTSDRVCCHYGKSNQGGLLPFAGRNDFDTITEARARGTLDMHLTSLEKVAVGNMDNKHKWSRQWLTRSTTSYNDDTFDVAEAVKGFLCARTKELELLEPIFLYKISEGHIAKDVLSAIANLRQSCASLSAMRSPLYRNGTRVEDRAPFTDRDRATKQKFFHGSRLESIMSVLNMGSLREST